MNKIKLVNVNEVGQHLVARPKNQIEPDLLLGFEVSDFVVKDLEGNKLLIIQHPTSGWSHDQLESLSIAGNIYDAGCDFYLDQQWIGSTEI